MNILRLGTTPLTVSYTGLTPNDDYFVEVYDDYGVMLVSETVTAAFDGMVEYVLPPDFSKYDQTCSLYLYSMVNDAVDEAVVIDSLYIYRPYVAPTNDMTQDELEDFLKQERAARQIIDSITGGFYYKKAVIQMVGNGTDYLPVYRRVNKINYVYKNNVLVYDRFNTVDPQEVYYITPDKTAVTVYVGGEANRLESAAIQTRKALSDAYSVFSTDYDSPKTLSHYEGGMFFPKGADYVIFGEAGWSVVPQDISEACSMLMNDISCNKLSYVQKYITEYETDQFRIKYSDMALKSKGTGNLDVDRILSNYTNTITYIGVL